MAWAAVPGVMVWAPTLGMVPVWGPQALSFRPQKVLPLGTSAGMAPLASSRAGALPMTSFRV